MFLFAGICLKDPPAVSTAKALEILHLKAKLANQDVEAAVEELNKHALYEKSLEPEDADKAKKEMLKKALKNFSSVKYAPDFKR